uniref:glutathione S-transferase family protein n=1 Tax=Salmonella sp. s54925 TaxID=3159674 RepID=UPI003980064F
FFFGEKITYADINFFCFVNGYIGAGELAVPEIMSKFPELTKLYNGVMNEPKILAYLKKRPPTDGR